MPKDANRRAIAYLILVHADPVQAARLCSTLLLDEHADIYIHVDQKSTRDYSACKALDPERVQFVAERHKVYWAGFGMVMATLALLRAAVEAGRGYHHLVLLSGHDYPLHHPREINQYFRDAPFRQHINRINVLDSPDYYLHQVERFHFREAWVPFRRVDKVLRKAATLLARPIRRRLIPGVVPCEGSSWWAVTEECGACFLEMARTRPEFMRLYRYTMAPDEHFFHTLVENSPFAAGAPPVMPYTGKGMWKKANFHVVHPSLKKVYTLEDFDEVMASGRMFLRKLNTGASTSLMDRIDEQILAPVSTLTSVS